MCPFPCQTNMQNRQDLWLIWISALISQSCWLKKGAVLKWGKDVVFGIGGGGTEVGGRQLGREFFEHFEKSRKCSTAAGLWWVRESRRRIGLYLKILSTTCDRNLIVVHTNNKIHNTCAYWCIQEDYDLLRWWMPDQFRNSNIALLSYELPFLTGIELSRTLLCIINGIDMSGPAVARQIWRLSYSTIQLHCVHFCMNCII